MAGTALICIRCNGAGKVSEVCARCGGRGWCVPAGFSGGFNCHCSNLRCISCGGTGRKIERVP